MIVAPVLCATNTYIICINCRLAALSSPKLPQALATKNFMPIFIFVDDDVTKFIGCLTTANVTGTLKHSDPQNDQMEFAVFFGILIVLSNEWEKDKWKKFQ